MLRNLQHSRNKHKLDVKIQWTAQVLVGVQHIHTYVIHTTDDPLSRMHCNHLHRIMSCRRTLNWKVAVVGNIEQLSGGNEHRLSFGSHTNPGPPEYETGVSVPHIRLSIVYIWFPWQNKWHYNITCTLNYYNSALKVQSGLRL
jgi:hypothetical protein